MVGRLMPGLMLLLSTAAFSTAALFVMLISADVWTMLCLRGFFASIFIFVLLLVFEKGRWINDARHMFEPVYLFLGIASAGAMYFYLRAFQLTTASDVVVIYATVPFVTAGIARFTLGDVPTRGVLLGSGLALMGMLGTFSGSFSAGRLGGDLCAAAMTVLMAIKIVSVRFTRRYQYSAIFTSLVPAVLSFLATLPFAHLRDLVPHQVVLLAVFGVSQLGLGLLFLTLGAQNCLPSGSMGRNW